MGQIDNPTPTSATRPAAARPEHAGQATTATASGRYSLDFSGRRLEVEASRDGLNTKAQLYVDGELVDESETSFEANRLHGDSVEVTVQWSLFGGVKSCLATPLDADGKKKANADIPFTPSAGTFAAKLDDFGNRHPTLYASRHVLVAAGEVLIGLLGISAILFGLLPRLDLPPLPSIPLPDLDVTLPDWLRAVVGIPDAIISVPVGWVRSLWERFDLSIPFSDWIRTIVGSAKWWVPFLIALFVAVEEVERQRRRTAAAPAELGTDVNDVPRDSDADTAKSAPLHANSAKRSEETDDQLSPSRGASHDE